VKSFKLAHCLALNRYRIRRLLAVCKFDHLHDGGDVPWEDDDEMQTMTLRGSVGSFARNGSDVNSTQTASLTERNYRLAHSRNCSGLGLLLGYLATSGAKSGVAFLLGDPICCKGDKISRPSLVSLITHGFVCDSVRTSADASAVSALKAKRVELSTPEFGRDIVP